MQINILSDLDLIDKIESLKKEGFTQIKLPGGTSKNRKHYSGAVIPHYVSETKKIYFLGLPYDPKFYKTQNDAGFDKKVDGEIPEQTAIREVVEETGLFLNLEDLKELQYAKKLIFDKVETKKVIHTKHFFLAKSFTGSVFEFPGGNPIDGETAAPLWLPAELFNKELWAGHQKAFKESLKILAENRETYLSIVGLM